MPSDETIEELRADMKYALSELGKSTVIPAPLTERTRNGLYCIMEAYGLSFRTCQRADWSWIEICESEDAKALNAEEIKARDFDEDKFIKACTTIAEQNAKNGNSNNGEVVYDYYHDDEPGYYDPNKSDRPELGWLAPNGDFTPADFGDHEYKAHEIISSMGWDEDFLLEYADRAYSPCASDYLIDHKGYALIHNPSSPLSKPFVTKSETRPLTKRQREFLYDYYMSLDDSLSANMYIED